MKSIKIILSCAIAIALISTTQQATAQTAAFMMSSVGTLAGASSNVAAINFQSVTNCLDVQTGIAVLNGDRGNGQFAINCEVTMKFNSLGIKLYPNPVQTQTRIQLVKTPPLTETFNVTIWSAEGSLITTKKETGYNLFQGVTIDLSNLSSGTYVIKIESPSYIDALKFVKAH